MDVDKVEIRSPGGPNIVLDYKLSRHNLPYYVKDIAGLDADSIEFAIIGKVDGGLGTSLTQMEPVVRDRELVFTIGLNPYSSTNTLSSYGNLRDNLYRIIASHRNPELTIRFWEGTRQIYIRGYVSKLEASGFGETQEAVLTVSCKDDPMFRGTPEVEEVASNLPLPNSVDLTFVDSVSTAPHGAVARFKIVNVRSSYTFLFPDPFTLHTAMASGGIVKDDLITIDNRPGQRKVVRSRSGQWDVHISDTVHKNAFWPIVYPGNNAWERSTDLYWDLVKHRHAFWGI